ncbi:MAG: NAD-dependent epimerase/dehydratase family protein [Bacteroides sp.]|nr:NAD-dependent epimerase/dehydratase family protein [Bacteroides sp.]
MIKIGITGQSGFIGTNLFNRLQRYPDIFQIIPFSDSFFEREEDLRKFVSQCDAIVHLAAMMRSPKEGEVYATNMSLINSLISAVETEKVYPDLFFASSIQENNGSEYGRCKLDGKKLLCDWAIKHGSGFGCMVFPNLFGPYAKPNSHSFIATFCYKLIHNDTPVVINDNLIPLKYIDSVLDELVPFFQHIMSSKSIEELKLKPDYELKVTEVLSILKSFCDSEKKGSIPIIRNQVDMDLYTTYNSYKDK